MDLGRYRHHHECLTRRKRRSLLCLDSRPLLPRTMCRNIPGDAKLRVSPTCGKAGRPRHLQKPDGGGRCLHSSGEWSSGVGAAAGLREHWGLPGSQEACQQPLSDQRGGSGPKGLHPQPSPTHELSFSTIALLTQVVD